MLLILVRTSARINWIRKEIILCEEKIVILPFGSDSSSNSSSCSIQNNVGSLPAKRYPVLCNGKHASLHTFHESSLLDFRFPSNMELFHNLIRYSIFLVDEVAFHDIFHDKLTITKNVYVITLH